MAANSVVTPDVLRNTERLAQASKLNLGTVLERSEEVLRKAFGDDEEIIASSLRGF
jgi:hypothetical protein